MVVGSRLAALLPVLLVAGCASLSAEVDVLDPEYIHQVRSELRLGRLIRESAAGDSVVDMAIREICTEYQRGRLALYDVTLRTARSVQSPSGALSSAIGSSQDSRDAVAGQPPEQNCVEGRGAGGFIDRNALLGKFRAIGCSEGACTTANATEDDLRQQRLAAAIEYQSLLDSYPSLVNTRLGELQSGLGMVVASTLSAPQASIKAELTERQSEARRAATNAAQQAARKSGYLGAEGQTLVLDEIAFAASKADKTHWSRRMNRAKGNGLFGSTDVVLKLESTGDFSVKGLVFDARSTALAARKATLSTLQILAAGSGLQFSADGDKSNGDGKAQQAANEASRTLASAKAKLAADELATQHYRAALLRIAAATIAAADNVQAASGDAGKIKDARQKAKSLFNANKPLLQAQAKEGGQ